MLKYLILIASGQAVPYQVCDDGWYHGYQGLGVIYTSKTFPYDSDDLVVGGGIASGCQSIKPQETFDSCAIIEYFDASDKATPSWTFIKSSYISITATGIRWGLTSVKGLAISKDGINLLSSMQVGSGISQTTDITSVPNGQGLLLIFFDTVSFSPKRFAINSLTQVPGSYSVAISGNSRYGFVLAYSNIDLTHNLVVVNISPTFSFQTVYQFDASIKWQALSTMQSKGTNSNCNLFGYQSGSFTYLETSGQSINQFFKVALDSTFTSAFTDSSWRFKGAGSTDHHHIAVYDHEPETSTLMVFVKSDDSHSQSVDFHRINIDSSALMRVDDVKVLLQADTVIYISGYEAVSQKYFYIVYSPTGFDVCEIVYLTFVNNINNGLFTMDQSIFGQHGLLLSQASYIGLSTTTNYGATDGFVWSDTVGGCFSMTEMTPSEFPYPGSAVSGDGTLLTEPSDSSPSNSNLSFSFSSTSLQQYAVVNPCRLRLNSPTTTQSQTINAASKTVSIKPTSLKDTCPFTESFSLYMLNTDITSVLNTWSSAAVTDVIQASSVPTNANYNNHFTILMQTTSPSPNLGYDVYFNTGFYGDSLDYVSGSEHIDIIPCTNPFTLIAPNYPTLTIMQTGSTQVLSLAPFTLSEPDCTPITYSATYTTVSGIVDQTWFTLAQSPELSIIEKYLLTFESTVNVVITATTLYTTNSASFIVAISNVCVDSLITAPSVSDLFFTQTGSSYVFPLQSFTPVDTMCVPISYTVDFAIAGSIDSSWFVVDATAMTIKLLQKSVLPSVQVVIITLHATSQWATSKTSYALIIEPAPIASVNLTVAANSTTNSTSVSVKTTATSSNTTNKTATGPSYKPVENIKAYLKSLTQPKKSNTTKNASPLTASIKSITKQGLVTIQFSESILTPLIYKNISNDCNNPEYIQTIDQVLTLTTVPGIDVDNNDERIAILNYNLTSWNTTSIDLLVTWKNPYQLSLNGLAYADDLQVYFEIPQLFISAVTQQVLANDTVISYPVPKQVTLEAMAKQEAIEETVSNVMDVLAGGNLVLNIVFAFSLKFLWGFVNMLQFLVFMQLWDIDLPDNALAVMKFLKSIALLEFIPTASITGAISGWFGLDPADESNIVNQNGIMLVIGLVLMLVLIIVGIASYFITQANYTWYRRYRSIKGMIFYNTFIRFILQSNLKMGIAAATTLSVATSYASGSVIVALIELSFFCMCPMLFRFILHYNRKDLEKPSMNGKIGSLYLGLKENSKGAMMYSSVFMVRRLFFIMLTFAVSAVPCIQVQLFVFSTVMYIVYILEVRPHTDRFQTRAEVLNEVLLILICYHFVLFTNLIQDEEMLVSVGYSLVAHLCLLLAVNIGIMFGINLQVGCRSLKLKRLKRKQDKMIKNRKLKNLAQESIKKKASETWAVNVNQEQELVNQQDQLIKEHTNHVRFNFSSQHYVPAKGRQPKPLGLMDRINTILDQPPATLLLNVQQTNDLQPSSNQHQEKPEKEARPYVIGDNGQKVYEDALEGGRKKVEAAIKQESPIKRPLFIDCDQLYL